MAKRQPICMLKPAYNFLNHTFTSFSSTGQKVLQTCPSLTKLLPCCVSGIRMFLPHNLQCLSIMLGDFQKLSVFSKLYA